jgi:phosphomannomutase
MAMAGPSFYLRRDLHFDAASYPDVQKRVMATLDRERPTNLAGRAVARIVQLDTKDGTKFFLDDGSWLLLRLSGTEPLVRVYAETRSQAELAPLLDAGEKMVREAR